MTNSVSDATTRRCDCENEKCQLDHVAGNCLETATAPVTFGKICPQCAVYMPAEFVTNYSKWIEALYGPDVTRRQFMVRGTGIDETQAYSLAELYELGFFDGDPEVTSADVLTLIIGAAKTFGGGAAPFGMVSRVADVQTGVELVASQYNWECPNPDCKPAPFHQSVNAIPESKTVTCGFCEATYPVTSILSQRQTR